MLKLTAPDGLYEIRHISLDGIRVGQVYDTALEVVATEAHTTAMLGCSHSGYLEASVAGGGFSAVPTDVQSGFDLGTFAADEVKNLVLRLTVPSATRDEAIELYLGIGV